MTTEHAIIGILIVNLLAFVIRELRVKQKNQQKAFHLNKCNNLEDKMNSLNFTINEFKLKNEILENRVDFLQVHLDRYTTLLESYPTESDGYFVKEYEIKPKQKGKSYTKPSDSVKSKVVKKIKPKTKTKKPTKKQIQKLIDKYNLTQRQAYRKAYYNRNKKK